MDGLVLGAREAFETPDVSLQGDLGLELVEAVATADTGLARTRSKLKLWASLDVLAIAVALESVWGCPLGPPALTAGIAEAQVGVPNVLDEVVDVSRMARETSATTTPTLTLRGADAPEPRTDELLFLGGRGGCYAVVVVYVVDQRLLVVGRDRDEGGTHALKSHELARDELRDSL